MIGERPKELNVAATDLSPNQGQRRRFGDRFGVTCSLRTGSTGQTLRAIDREQGGEVVVRTIAGPDSPAVAARLEQEVEAFSRLDGSSVARPIAAGRQGNSFCFVVAPYVSGVTLQERLRVGPLGVADALTVGRQALASLAQVHEHGFVHGAVRPSNLVVGLADGCVERTSLLDLGVAELSRWAGATPESSVAAARYSSPEGAGLVAHDIDARADLYSLGAVLFECLAGRPLFGADSVGSVLRQHLAASVPSLRSLGLPVPAPFDEVIQRLLRKDPANRYSSARAALADLDQIAAALASGHATSDVLIGAVDARATLTQPAFVGRQRELASIEAQMDLARQGQGALVLIEGASGAGKTALIDELSRRVAKEGAWVLRGQGVDQAAARPLRMLDGVVDDLVHRVGADAELGRQLRAGLGLHLEAVVDALPNLAGVVGSVASGTLGPEAYGEARSLPALSAFLDALSALGLGALIVLDDCQWADELTLKLVAHWASHRSAPEAAGAHAAGTGPGAGPPVMLVVAFRSEETPAEHPLRHLDSAAHVVLAPLDDDEMGRVLVSMAGPLPDVAVETVARLADGNPFMATAVLRGLVETGALVKAPAGWQVQQAALADVQTSRHAAAFLARRMELLPASARRLLAVGALLGKEFDGAMAAALSGQEPAEVASAIEEARSRHILWISGTRCSFVHDKVREALLGQLSEEDRRSLHRAAALAFEAEDQDRVFDMAYHFDAAGDAVRALPYALAAATRARGQHALEVAERQYRIAERGVAGADDEARRQVAEGLGDVLLLRGRYEEAAIQLRAAVNLAADDAVRAVIEGKLGELAFKQGDMAGASEAVERAVRLLGRRMPRRQVGFVVSLLGEVVVQILHSAAPGRFLARRRPEVARDDLLVVRLYSRLAYIYWFQRGRVPCLWAHLREMNLAERYPASPELAQAYSEHAPVMTVLPWFSRGLAYAERSLQIRTDLGDVWGQGQSLHFIGVVLYASSRFQDCIDRCRQGADLLDRTGDCWEANTARWHIAFSLYRLGELGAAVEASRLVRQAAVEIGDHQAAGIALGAWAKASSGDLPARGLQAALERLGEDVHTGAEVLQGEAVRLLGAGRPAEAVVVLRRAAAMVAAKGLKQEYVAPIQPWLATALRLQVEAMPTWSPRRRRLLRQTLRATRRGRRVARSYPNNLPHALREAALVAAMRGRERDSLRWFDASLRAAEQQSARSERAQTLLARGLTGVELGWAGAAAQVAEARGDLAQIAPSPKAEPSGAVSLSLLDRFDSLLSVGKQIASALTPADLYVAVGDATQALLRAEDCLVLGLGADDPRSTTILVGRPGQGFAQPLVARALAVGRPVVDEAVEGEQGSTPHSALCAPVHNRDRAVACVYLTSGQVGGLFGEEEIRLAEFITTLAGTALENIDGFSRVQALSRSLEKRVEERTSELGDAYGLLTEANRRLRERSDAVALVKTIAVAANEAPSMEAALQVGLDAVCRHTGWPLGHIYRVSDEAKGVGQPTDLWHLDDPGRFSAFKRATDTTALPLGRGLPGRVMATGVPAWIIDVRLDPNFPRCAGGVELGVRTAFAVPLLAGPEVIGVLEFFSDRVLPLDQALLDLISEVGTELGRMAERKRAEDALRHSEERTRSILSAANEAFIGMDEHGLITDWNPSAEAIFGWSADEVLGRCLSDTIIPARTRQAHEQGLRHSLATGEGPVLGRRIEVTALRRDQSEFPAELSIWCTTTGAKTFNAFVQDITERKRTEQDLAEARDQAMEASRLKSQFLATMSHEIRTPLNGVIGLSELLLDTELAGQQRPYAEGLHTAGETLLALVNDILDFSKIEAGRLELEEVTFDPCQLVADVVGLLSGSAEGKGLRLAGACSDDLPAALRGDPARLRQILVNLTSNAVKFTEAGEVFVRVERTGPSTADRMTVALTVTDSGIGIAPADHVHILEPFSQADASTTRRFGGTGLGLAICRQLAEAMGGTLSLSSQPGQGSTFRVTVPLGWHHSNEPTGQPPQPTTVPAPANKGGGLVLIVEDNATNQMVATAMLAKLGYQPEVVSDGRQAVAAVARTRYAVVLMDCQMPVMDGYEATRAIRAGEGSGSRVPIIAMTANALPEDRDRCAASGMDDHVSKPFTLATLEGALSLWTTGAGPLPRAASTTVG